MKIKLLSLLTFITTTVSFSQDITVDGLDYEILSNDPNEVLLLGGTFTNPFVIPNSITFENVTYSVTEIHFFAFSDNAALTEVTIPATVTQIYNNAFSNTGLTEVIALGNTPAAIDSNSFGDRSVMDLTVPPGSEEDYLNNGWTGFASVNGTVSSFEVGDITYGISSISANTVDVISSTITGSLNIPQTVTFNTTVYTVTGIAGDAFRENSLTSVTIPNTVTSIGNSAFRDNQITSINIPNTVTAIGGSAFRDNQLTTANIPTSLTVLEFSVFNNNQLSSIVIPDGIIDIKPLAFNNNNLTSVTIPASVTSIGNFAFTANPITEVEALGNMPPSIGSLVFDEENIIDLTIPDGTEAAYEAAGWTGFNSVNGIQQLEVGVTFDIDGLDYTIIDLAPNEVEAAGGTTIPTNLVIPETVTIQDELFTVTGVGNGAFEGLNITSVILPNNLITIRGAAFKNNLITEVSLPESLTIIETEAFRVNQISTVIIPQNVTSIAAFAFSGGNPVTTVICEGLVPSSVASSGAANTFANRQNIDLFIPVGTTQDYTDATWTGFKSVTEANKALVLKIYLQGASLNPNTGEENLMRDDLRVAGVLPTTSPYADVATATTTAFDATGNDAIVDWVFVELRDATNSNTIIESASALLQRDGDVVSTDGVSLFEFNATPDDYFIAVKHRNHLGVILEQVKRVSPVATILDFTKTDSPISLGSNSQTDIGLPANILGLWAGDANADGTVRLSGANAEPADIRDTVLNDPGNFFNSIQFAPQGYFNEDVNMNGELRFSGANSEPLFVRDNILGNPGNIFNSLFSTIFAQLPSNATRIEAQQRDINKKLRVQNKRLP